MLQKLSIRNYAIIDNLALQPDPHLNTVTGETGAGKSIILGALSLILGERADSSVLINKEEKCVVEATFEVGENDAFRAALREEELDDEAQCIIRREIAVSGKSRAFVNDTPVNLNTLNRLTSLLVDLHQQFDHLALQDDTFQLDVLDAIAKNGALLKEYVAGYNRYRKVSSELQELQTQQAQWQKESDYKQFLLDELVQASFKESEIEDAEAQLKTLTHAERIGSVLSAARALLEEGEQPIINELKKTVQQMNGIAEWLPTSAPITDRLSSVHAELKDLCHELEHLECSVNLDAGLMQELQERIDLGYKLFKKHGVPDTAGLLALQAQLTQELKASFTVADRIEELSKEQGRLLEEVQTAAENLSAQRKKVAPGIASEVTKLLALVGMPNARFDIRLNKAKEPGITGVDIVDFVLDANKSGQFQPLHKAASGGEMSRIMLSIKSLTAQAMQLPTLIFDEVDTGISGEAARQVGFLLRQLADYHQVICITHQPQVAARGSQHFFVYKEPGTNGRINTRVRTLAGEDRVLAIARMIGGEQPSKAAVENAKELVEA
jgi:DNA repair protein RecN (Recombination protein N)